MTSLALWAHTDPRWHRLHGNFIAALQPAQISAGRSDKAMGFVAGHHYLRRTLQRCSDRGSSFFCVLISLQRPGHEYGVHGKKRKRDLACATYRKNRDQDESYRESSKP